MAKLTDKEITTRFPTDYFSHEGALLYDEVMVEYRKMVSKMIKLVPDCRERRIAIDRIQESSLWMSRALGRHY